MQPLIKVFIFTAHFGGLDTKGQAQTRETAPPAILNLFKPLLCICTVYVAHSAAVYHVATVGMNISVFKNKLC